MARTLPARRAARYPCRRLTAPLGADAKAELDVGRRSPGPSSRPVSSTQGRPSKRGSERNQAQPSSPSSPSPMTAWRSRFEPERHLGVVEVQRAEALDADDLHAAVDQPRRAAGPPGCGPHSRRREVTGIQAEVRGAGRPPAASRSAGAPRRSARGFLRCRRCPPDGAGRARTRREPRRSPCRPV